jgi:hypothetical protein
MAITPREAEASARLHRPGPRFGALLLVTCLLPVGERGHAEPAGPPPECGSSPTSKSCSAQSPDGHTWLDRSYDYLTTRSDTLAQQLDSFFGQPDSERESADSVLRLFAEYEWDAEQGSDQKLRLRGKVDLPELDRRLSLVLGEDEDYRQDVVPGDGRENTDVGLQYRLLQQARSRLYFSVGTNASLEFRSALRYRYERALAEDWRLRLTERVYYKEGEGFGTIARSDLDYLLGPDRILRWTADLEYGEETDGVEWGSRLSYLMQLNEREAFGYFAAVAGMTDPEAYTDTWALGLRYRRTLFRPWMFLEIEPSHQWRKETPWDPRDPAWVFTVRLELLEELENRRAGR